MYHQEPEFRLAPMPVDDDRGAQNRHRLELPAWFYIRYPAHFELKSEIIAAIQAISPDFRIASPNLQIDRMPTLAECAALHRLAQEHGCELRAQQRIDEDFRALVATRRASRTGRSS